MGIISHVEKSKEHVTYFFLILLFFILVIINFLYSGANFKKAFLSNCSSMILKMFFLLRKIHISSLNSSFTFQGASEKSVLVSRLLIIILFLFLPDAVIVAFVVFSKRKNIFCITPARNECEL